MLGIPKARLSNDGHTAEVIRVATDGVKNGCSMLYGALVRIAWGMGYTRVLTYTLENESGSSLRAAGWRCDGARETGGPAEWDRRNGRKVETMFFDAKVPDGRKVRWVIERTGSRC